MRSGLGSGMNSDPLAAFSSMCISFIVSSILTDLGKRKFREMYYHIVVTGGITPLSRSMYPPRVQLQVNLNTHNHLT